MWVTALLGLLGQGVGGFFGLKNKQADLVSSAIETIGHAQDADANYAQSSANAISALYQSGPPVERLWRPVAMWVFLSLIVARWFGFVPPGVSEHEINQVYEWFAIGLIGYMPLRSVDKWMQGFQIGSVLKTFINKKMA